MADGQAQPASPRARYEADLTRADFQHDLAQAQAVGALQAIYEALLNHPTHTTLFGKKRRVAVTGLYLWGSVGRGKTYLMDCFFEALPFSQKTRLHFYRFMQKVHVARKRYAHRPDPLKLIADDWAADRVLCFDEFFVADIADAMILSRLTEGLFERGVTLIATSNTAPDDLYAGGLQRELFLPAITRIKQHCRVFHLDDGPDFRLYNIETAATYQCPNNEAAEAVLAWHFDKLATGRIVDGGNVKVLGRKIPVRRRAESVVWFDFAELCIGYRSANDYIELAREFPAIMLTNVPVMDDRDNDAMHRFTSAIDEFYDRRVKLFVIAEAEPDNLYTGHRLSFAFARTASRLHEMSSQVYLTEAHRH